MISDRVLEHYLKRRCSLSTFIFPVLSPSYLSNPTYNADEWTEACSSEACSSEHVFI